MGGTLFVLVAYFNSTEYLSQQLRKRSSIHGLYGSISSQTTRSAQKGATSHYNARDTAA